MLTCTGALRSDQWPTFDSKLHPTLHPPLIDSYSHQRSTAMKIKILASALCLMLTALTHAQTLTLGTKLELNTLDPHF